MEEKFELDLYRDVEERLIDSITCKSYEIYSSEYSETDNLSNRNSSYELYGPSYDEGAFPIIDEEDVAIILEKEAHFSGSFPLMIEYYKNDENKGINEEISYERILELYTLEKALADHNQSLTTLLLQGRDAEHLQMSKRAYKSLAEIVQQHATADCTTNIHPSIVLAECILSEENIETLAERYKRVFIGHEKLLYILISSDTFYDRIFPGYGLAPVFAIKVLGKLKDQNAIPLLFQQLFRYTHFRADIDEEILISLRAIGKPTKEKALSLVLHSPWSIDTEKALHVLIEFLPDSSISEEIMDYLLLSPTALSNSFLNYAILLLEGLPTHRIKDLQIWRERVIFNLDKNQKDELERIINCSLRGAVKSKSVEE